MPELFSPQVYPAVSELIRQIDDYLRTRHPTFFSEGAIHPFLPVKRSKVIHDNLWGTNKFSWRELVLMDSPILQRLASIHQTGLANQIYPSANHTRFEHSLGVTVVASRVFDALAQRHRARMTEIAKAAAPGVEPSTTLARLRQELRLAALFHDTGHSLLSHSSEEVFQHLDLVKNATAELASFVGKKKGAGESIALAMTLCPCVQRLLERARQKLLGDDAAGDDQVEIDMANVALIIVGRSKHPYLQFLGDIISSGFDADKLDYLLRDATAAGLPLRYDFERYLYAAQLERCVLADGEGELERLYATVGTKNTVRHDAGQGQPFPHYETYRLRLPAKAMNTIEQMVICKLMLFSYIYHHPKVRAAEGTLVRLLNYLVAKWRNAGESDGNILHRFLDMTDSTLQNEVFLGSDDPHVRDTSYRLINRLLPREVYRLNGAVASDLEMAILKDFLTNLQDKSKGAEIVSQLEHKIGEEMRSLDPTLGATPQEVLQRTAVRVDVPKPPKFEDVDELLVGQAEGAPPVTLMQVFPIGQWTHAYTHFRYFVRIFAYSEYTDKVEVAARRAMKAIIKIESEVFYSKILRKRT